jgi:hypothetical protein
VISNRGGGVKVKVTIFGYLKQFETKNSVFTKTDAVVKFWHKSSILDPKSLPWVPIFGGRKYF